MSAATTNHVGRPKAAPLFPTARFAEHLRRFEIRSGISRFQLFHYVGCSYFTAALILRGEATQTPKNLAIAGNVGAIIGCSPAEVAVGVDLPTADLAVVLTILDCIRANLSSEATRAMVDALTSTPLE